MPRSPPVNRQAAWVGLVALLLPWAGCMQHQRAGAAATAADATPDAPLEFDLSCSGPYFEFTARTQAVQATLPEGYTAHDVALGNT